MPLLLGAFIKGAGAGNNFSPTFNGAQNPTIVGDSRANYEYFDFGSGSSNALAFTDITVENSVSDSIINIIGSQSGGPTDKGGSFQQASVNIFNLNQRPDTVRIRLVSASKTDSDPTNFPSTAPKVGTFTDDVDFDPANGSKFGYQGRSSVNSIDPPTNPPTVNESGTIQPIVEFTFKKTGFNDLVVTYRVRATALTQAFDSS